MIPNTYEAQYGRSGAGVVNMTTKRGPDQYQGTAFEYFRNDHLNANDFWSNLYGVPKGLSTGTWRLQVTHSTFGHTSHNGSKGGL